MNDSPALDFLPRNLLGLATERWNSRHDSITPSPAINEDAGNTAMSRRSGPKQRQTTSRSVQREILEDFRVVDTTRGLRLIQSGDVLSEMRNEPAPTHDLFDVLAALMACLSPGPRLLMLGFAGGGVVAPLRAMGCTDPIEAVDLSRKGEVLFRKISARWAGEVRVHQADAMRWLRTRSRHFDCILEDLSIPSPEGSLKPDFSLDPLPQTIAKRLKPRGVAIFNILPFPHLPWKTVLETLCLPFRQALLIRSAECENRVLVCGRHLPTARLLSTEVRRALGSIASNQTKDLSVRRAKASGRRASTS